MLKNLSCEVTSIGICDPLDLRAWFEEQSKMGDGSWFLGFSDEGIIWGTIQDGHLITSGDDSPDLPQLKPDTFQQGSIFGHRTEVRLWRDNHVWHGCRIEEMPCDAPKAFDEERILLRTKAYRVLAENKLLPAGQLYLYLRHYISYNEDGQARIWLSRLFSLGGATDDF